VALGLLLRSRLKETPVFEQLRRNNAVVRSPVTEVLKTSLRPMLCAWGARLGDNSLAYINESFVIVYVTQQFEIDAGRAGIGYG